MKAKFIILTSTIFALVLTIMLWGFASKNKLLIDGAWSIVEVQMVKSDGTFTSTFPKESQAIFLNNYYSFCWTSHVSTVQSWQMADSAKLSRFNQSIINTGTFELRESLLTTKATFAMNPMFTNGLAKFRCTFNGDTLVLTGLSVFSSGNVAHPIYAGGSHFVNKLLKVRHK